MAAFKPKEIYKLQKEFFRTGKTRDIDFRLSALKKLSALINNYENDIYAALKKDLGKCKSEAFAGEIAYAQKEIQNLRKKLKTWAKPRKVKTPLGNKPGKSRVHYEPYGTALVISPWNYPFGLLLSPVAAAIAAGNCVIAKPSEISENTSRLLHKYFTDNFPTEFIECFQGGAEITQSLIRPETDYIFFTGSPGVGKKIMSAAAENLTPVTLELGGKNPCIIDKKVDVKTAARRIAWGKFFNAGQTCVAPDHLLIHKDIKKEFLTQLKKTLTQFYGEPHNLNADYGKIINEKHFSRVSGYLKDGEILYGGKTNREKLSISPTLIAKVKQNSALLEEEIFGPVLPVFTYENLNDEIEKINSREKPLIIYFFTKNKALQDEIIEKTSSGSVCVNGTIHIFMSPELPFGGIGQSGMGKYHGKASFETFSHPKAVLRKKLILDIKQIYPPYDTPLKWLKKAIKIFF